MFCCTQGFTEFSTKLIIKNLKDGIYIYIYICLICIIYIYIYMCYMLCGKKGTGGYDKEGRQPTRHNIYEISTHKSLYIHVILCQNSMARLFGPVYTWSLHAFSLIGYLSDLLKLLNLHLATSMCLRKTDINQFFNSRQ